MRHQKQQYMNEGTCTSTTSFSKELWPQLLDHLPGSGDGLGSVAQSAFPEKFKGVCILSFLTNTFTMLKSGTRHTTGGGLPIPRNSQAVTFHAACPRLLWKVFRRRPLYDFRVSLGRLQGQL